ncbi:MAG: hypothetical protein WCS43_03145 [Verrucomicrobiota bacterium]
MIHRCLKYLFAVLACVTSAHAQIAATLKLDKDQHLAGEPVIAVVTITNHAGKELIFSSDGRLQWLDFVIRDSRGNPITPRGRALFGAMKIGPGQTLGREVDLAQYFQLEKPGNFTVSAVIQSPQKNLEGATTNRVFFNQSSGVLYWSQKVGLPGNSGNTREFRVLNFSGDTKSQIYAQIEDGHSGQLVRTFLLGDVLMMRKPLSTIDRNQRMHVMFLSTPTMWVHNVVDTDGRLVSRQIHQRGPQGDPQLLTFGDGTVRVANSLPYDPKAVAAERAKIRKASDRPAVSY